ncbi:DUF5665 domain-containing protein [Patescibacteria group bacterium]
MFMEKNQDIKNLNKNIKELNKSFGKANSFKLSFFRGLMVGVGTAIGATIIAAMVVTILLKTIKTAKNIPFFGELIETTKIEKFIPQEDETGEIEINEDEQNLSVKKIEQEQMFESARAYIKKYSAEGMEVELSIINQVDKWAILQVVPVTIETDNASVIMEKVEGKWITREFGTFLSPEWMDKAPELFIED